MAEQWRVRWTELVQESCDTEHKIVEWLKAWIGESGEAPQSHDRSSLCTTTTTTIPVPTPHQINLCAVTPKLIAATLINPRFACLSAPLMQQLLVALKCLRAVTILHPFCLSVYQSASNKGRRDLHRDMTDLQGLGLVVKTFADMPEVNEFGGRRPLVFMVWNGTRKDREIASLIHWRQRRRGSLAEEWPETPATQEVRRIAIGTQCQDEDQDVVFVRSCQSSMRAGHGLKPKAMLRYEAILKARPELAQEKEVLDP